jgi:ankyrin repeat protein
MWAARYCCAKQFNKADVIRCLVNELGADVNQPDENGFMPLIIAVQESNLEMMRCLVADLGADADRASKRAATPLHIAAGKGKLEMVQCLVKEFDGDVNLGDGEGRTPSQFAALFGHVAIVRYLVKDLGADVNRRTKNGCTPFFTAAQMGQLDTARSLVDEFGADVNETTQYGSTPLMIAAKYLHHTIVRYLLKHGADAQASHHTLGTAVDASKQANAPAEETASLQARTHCTNPSCTNAGLKKCERCLKVYFCGSICIRAHWPAHKAECKAAAAKLKAAANAT